MSPVFLLLLTLLPGALLAQERPPTPVIVAEVLEQPLVEDLSFVGRIQPRRSSRVATETEGRVIRRFTGSRSSRARWRPTLQVSQRSAPSRAS